jgi:hypothetical protein
MVVAPVIPSSEPTLEPRNNPAMSKFAKEWKTFELCGSTAWRNFERKG